MEKKIEFKADKEMVLARKQQSGRALNYAAEELQTKK